MIYTLQGIFASKAKRIYHPTRVIKDADAIMRRTIKKLIAIKDHLFDAAITRWKFYNFAKYHRHKAILIFRAAENADKLFRDAFLSWKEKKNTKHIINRVQAVNKLAFILEGKFRERFTDVVQGAKSFTNPRQALGRVWNVFARKYCGDLEKGFVIWRHVIEMENKRLRQTDVDRGLANIIKYWKSQLLIKYRRGLKSFYKQT